MGHWRERHQAVVRMTLTLVTATPAEQAEWILDNACKVAVLKFRAAQPVTAAFVLDAAQIQADILLGGAAC